MEEQYRFRSVNCINKSSQERLEQYLLQRDTRLFRLDGSRIYDKRTLLLQAHEDLPTAEGLAADNNWDAFVDNVWWGLSLLQDRHVSFLWTDAHLMLSGGLPDLLVAVNCFEHLSEVVANPKRDFSPGMTLNVFLIGEGNNFPDL